MPVNLNALIRYKTIDNCLRNKFVVCDINFLIQKCSEAISNKLGEPTSVSERTIRNDIRILRSDILGFNAPIVCEIGIYKYSEPGYSIFNTAISDKELLVEIQHLLIEEYERIESKKVKFLIKSLSEITGEKLPQQFTLRDNMIFEKKMPSSTEPNKNEIFQAKINNYLYHLKIDKGKSKKKVIIDYFKSKPTSLKIYKWEYILDGI